MAFVANKVRNDLQITLRIEGYQEQVLGPFLDAAGDPIDFSTWDTVHFGAFQRVTSGSINQSVYTVYQGENSAGSGIALMVGNSDGTITLPLDSGNVPELANYGSYACSVTGAKASGDTPQLLGTGTFTIAQ